MKVFISWSGERSRSVAQALDAWLMQVVQAVEPWMSSEIGKGSRWSPEIAAKLEDSRVGIICLTRENLTEPWILFEAGALSKTKDAQVCTFLLDLKPADVQQPLGQFQHTTFEKADVRKLVGDINVAIAKHGERSLQGNVLDQIFERSWPTFEADLQRIIAEGGREKQKQRTDREILEEVLELMRNQERRLTGQDEQHRKLLIDALRRAQPTGGMGHGAVAKLTANAQSVDPALTLANLAAGIDSPSKVRLADILNAMATDKGKGEGDK